MSSHLLPNHTALIEQLYDCLNRYDFATAATMVVSRTTDNYFFHWQDVRKTFPDFKLEPLDIIIEDEQIVVHSLFSGTHRGVAKLAHHGDLLVGVKATGRTVSASQMHAFQIVVSKLIELYVVRDDLSLYQQLKLLPQSIAERSPATHTRREVNFSSTMKEIGHEKNGSHSWL